MKDADLTKKMKVYMEEKYKAKASYFKSRDPSLGIKSAQSYLDRRLDPTVNEVINNYQTFWKFIEKLSISLAYSADVQLHCTSYGFKPHDDTPPSRFDPFLITCNYENIEKALTTEGSATSRTLMEILKEANNSLSRQFLDMKHEKYSHYVVRKILQCGSNASITDSLKNDDWQCIQSSVLPLDVLLFFVDIRKEAMLSFVYDFVEGFSTNYLSNQLKTAETLDDINAIKKTIQNYLSSNNLSNMLHETFNEEQRRYFKNTFEKGRILSQHPEESKENGETPFSKVRDSIEAPINLSNVSQAFVANPSGQRKPTRNESENSALVQPQVKEDPREYNL